MAIDRTPWNALVDDDGSNLVGSIWNKAAIKTVLLDPIDAAFLPIAAATSGTWTPADASGAGLAIAVAAARYWKLDKLVVIQGWIAYPITANAAAAKLGGLPFAMGGTPGGLYTTNSAFPLWLSVPAGATVMQLLNATNGVGKTNTELSGVGVQFSGMYLTA